MSARWSTLGSALACSGDMYAGVPSATPSDVMPPCSALLEALNAFATPKSVTIALPPESSTLSGLMSRCTIPCSCAYASADAISRSMRMAWLTGNSPCRARRTRSDSPSTNGIEVRQAVRLARREQRHDVWMLELGRKEDLALETFE